MARIKIILAPLKPLSPHEEGLINLAPKRFWVGEKKKNNIILFWKVKKKINNAPGGGEVI